MSRVGNQRNTGPLDCKVYVGDLGNNGDRSEIEHAFGRFGPLRNVWVARNPPGFAFVEFEDPRDAEDAARDLDGRTLCGRRVRVELSSGRSKPKRFGGGNGGGGRDRGGRNDERSMPRRRSRSRSPRRERRRSPSPMEAKPEKRSKTSKVASRSPSPVVERSSRRRRAGSDEKNGSPSMKD